MASPFHPEPTLQSGTSLFLVWETVPRDALFNLTTLQQPYRTHADCAQLLDVDDMIHMRVPDAKCIYTYIQELYRSLVQKGLVKTKKQ